MSCRIPRNMSLRVFVAVTAALLAVVKPQACAGDDTASVGENIATAEGIEFFERHVRPLFHEHCLECHATSGKLREADLALDSSAGIKGGGSRGVLYVAGDPDASLLMQAVRYDEVDLQMPPDGKLPDADLQRLEEWVRLGAPMPEHGASVETPRPAIDIAAGREFWSFRALGNHAVPQVDGDEWSNSAVDRFVLAKLQTAG
ncbi:MAG: hypothetical protein JNG89_04050, partial [Planctomycetaceae bacterium]|nr:hypothetical protein [Planctomycetaceae bacterium]